MSQPHSGAVKDVMLTHHPLASLTLHLRELAGGMDGGAATSCSLCRGTRTRTRASLPALSVSPTSYPDTVRLRFCHVHPTRSFYFWQLVQCALVQPRFRFRGPSVLAVTECETERHVVWTHLLVDI